MGCTRIVCFTPIADRSRRFPCAWLTSACRNHGHGSRPREVDDRPTAETARQTETTFSGYRTAKLRAGRPDPISGHYPMFVSFACKSL